MSDLSLRGGGREQNGGSFYEVRTEYVIKMARLTRVYRVLLSIFFFGLAHQKCLCLHRPSPGQAWGPGSF